MKTEKIVIFDTTLRDGEQSPGEASALSGGSGVHDLDAADVLVKGDVGMAEKRQPAAFLLRGVNQRVDPAVVHMIQMAVGQKGLHRSERDRKHIWRQRGEVTVARDVVERDFRKAPKQDLRVPVVVAEMKNGVRTAAGDRVRHRSGVSVGVGENRNPHPTRSCFSRDSVPAEGAA